MKFKDASQEARVYPRGLGADTAAVLKDVLDLSAGDIAELLRAKAVIARDFDGA
jgi:crotonobetainyl-CoA:carnitine CoA-transferase CaiB-like acyl-CoA transferase